MIKAIDKDDQQLWCNFTKKGEAPALAVGQEDSSDRAGG